MTETATTENEPLFTATEVQQFEADDVVAGTAIGKMLSALFLYTVLAMSFVTWWTYSSLSENHGQSANTSDHTEH
ncbi:MAG: hypothetical protein GY758_23740 [Fuerstiella sp.]|nr:hypothetical protein [Fuerstiella sp.]MCP4510142.1 hypothetical protein [Fuerstiella sp.]